MRAIRFRVFPILSLAALAACADPHAAAPLAEQGAGADPPALDASTVSYKDAQRRQAYRGLDYSSGRALIVSVEAAQIVAGPDPVAAQEELSEAGRLLAENDWLGAIAAHTKAVLLAPDDPRMYEALGSALIHNRRGERALAAYRGGLDLDPPPVGRIAADLHEGAGRALIGLGERADGLRELRIAVELDPEDAAAFAEIAIQSYYLHDDAAAWKALHRAEALGHAVPPQFRALLEKRTPESQR